MSVVIAAIIWLCESAIAALKQFFFAILIHIFFDGPDFAANCAFLNPWAPQPAILEFTFDKS
jgi:hypothetical protein